MKNKSEYLYPAWLRIWHWLNAVLFFSLIFTGINLQYANVKSPIINFNNAILIHNISGITLTLNYVFFFLLNIISGNYKQYIPKINGFLNRLIIQTKFYLYGIFNEKPHPFETTKEQKFNPLQQTTYLNIMYVLLPIIIFSGLALLFPELIINNIFGISGLTLTDIVHTSAGFILSVFMIGHIYLATTGTTISSNFKAMVTGWHESHSEHTNSKGTSNESETASVYEN